MLADAVTQQLAEKGLVHGTSTEAQAERRSRALLTVAEAAECLAIGRTAAYALVGSVRAVGPVLSA